MERAVVKIIARSDGHRRVLIERGEEGHFRFVEQARHEVPLDVPCKGDRERWASLRLSATICDTAASAAPLKDRNEPRVGSKDQRAAQLLRIDATQTGLQRRTARPAPSNRRGSAGSRRAVRRVDQPSMSTISNVTIRESGSKSEVGGLGVTISASGRSADCSQRSLPLYGSPSKYICVTMRFTRPVTSK